MITEKRERLEFIYEQNRAQALRQAIPNPMGLLSVVQSGNYLKAAACTMPGVVFILEQLAFAPYEICDKYATGIPADKRIELLPSDSEPDVLPLNQSAEVHLMGNDPTTFGLRVRCSAN